MSLTVQATVSSIGGVFFYLVGKGIFFQLDGLLQTEVYFSTLHTFYICNLHLKGFLLANRSPKARLSSGTCEFLVLLPGCPSGSAGPA